MKTKTKEEINFANIKDDIKILEQVKSDLIQTAIDSFCLADHPELLFKMLRNIENVKFDLKEFEKEQKTLLNSRKS